jgi:hypothetical protein
MCHNLGLLKFSVLPAQNFTQDILLQLDAFLSSLVLSHCSRLEVFNEAMQIVGEY